MKRALCGLLLALVLGLPNVTAEPWWDADAEMAPIRRQESATALRAYEAFAAGRYAQALQLLNRLTVSPDERTSLQTMRRLWEKRRDLGRIEPEFTYRALVINLTSFDVVTDNGSRITRTMTREEIERTELYQELTKKTYEAFSDGRMTIDFDMENVSDTVTSLTYAYEDGMEFPRMDSVPGLPELLRERIGDYDILVVHSGAHLTGTAIGGEWAVPYVEFALYGPRRGRLLLNIVHNYGIWVHELFHSFEGHAGIGTIHGYYSEPRVNFPGWNGVSGDQFDYYDWHFSSTMPALGLANLNFRNRYPDPTSDETFREVITAYRSVPLEDRFEADRFYYQGRAAGDAVRKEELYREAIALSPMHSSALHQLGELYRSQGRYEEAHDAYSITGRYFPRPSVLLGDAQSLMKLGELDAAIAAFEAATSSDARDAVEEYRKAEAYYELAILTDGMMGDREAAYRYVIEAIGLGYNFYRSRELMVRLQPGGLDYGEVTTRYRALLGETRAFAHSLMAVAGRTGDVETRLRYIEEAGRVIKLFYDQFSHDGDYRYSLGQYYYQAGEIYFAHQGNTALAHEYAGNALDMGFVWNRSVDLFVNTIPDDMDYQSARRLLFPKVSGSDKVEYGMAKLDERYVPPDRICEYRFRGEDRRQLDQGQFPVRSSGHLVVPRKPELDLQRLYAALPAEPEETMEQLTYGNRVEFFGHDNTHVFIHQNPRDSPSTARTSPCAATTAATVSRA
jgi:tetratricopeptide (TPR) repeat protein